MEKQKKQRKSNQVIAFMKNILKLQEIIKHDWNPLTLSSFQTFYIFQSKVLMHTNLDSRCNNTISKLLKALEPQLLEEL